MKPRAGKAFQPILPDLQGSRLKAEWFAVKGIYASAFTALKGVYTAQDDAGLSDRLTAQKQLLETLEEARMMMLRVKKLLTLKRLCLICLG
ncbi:MULTISPECIES: hypothetical protein [Kamptonema]|uniref:hypothetical protein n=1 Tax=Kamptonema TaxID=1501433 RepID=UPI0001DAC3CD|nr:MULTISPECIES: hypothetical protein [Kamptonema]CBN55390.1 hypothetical protein OSCI_1820006 [Kamptonema sp. PCC 6506]